MDDGLAPGDPQGFQEVAGADDVGVQGIDGGIEAGLGIALGRQVENIIRLDSFDDGEQGDQVVEVGILEKDPVFMIGPLKKMLDIIDGAAPAADTVDIPISIFQQIVRQMGAHHAGDAGYQGF